MISLKPILVGASELLWSAQTNFHPKMLRDRNYFRFKLLDDSDVPCITQSATG